MRSEIMRMNPYKNVLVCAHRSVFQVETDQVLSQFPVEVLIHLIQYEVEQVETGNQGGREVDIPGHRQVDVVLGANRVGSCKDRRPSIQCRDDTSLRN